MDEEGTLDIDDHILAGLEWVIASMHTPCIKPSTKENHTKAWLNIAKNPHVDVIGHCGDGRYDFDHETVIKAFKEYGKIVEIDNGSFGSRPHTESNCAEIARWCKRLEVPIVVDSDAHFAANIGVFDKAIKILTEIDFPERLIINTDVERFEQIVAQKRAGLNR
jgi:putative hydrolase